MIFRKATESDVDDIFAFIGDIKAEFKAKGIDMWQGVYPLLETVVDDVSSDEAYVAEIDGRMVAYMFICYSADSDHDTVRGQWKDSNPSTMHRLITRDDCRNRGLGSAMMEFWEEKAREHGCTSLRVETDLTNVPMLNLIHKFGFRDVGSITVWTYEQMAFEKILL